MTLRNTAKKIKKRILIIEDEVDLLNLYEKILEDDNSEIKKCSNASLGILELNRNPAFDLILIDLGLLELTGMQLFRYIENHYPDLSANVLFVTAGSWDMTSEDFINNHKSKTVLKPFDIEELQKRCKAIY